MSFLTPTLRPSSCWKSMLRHTRQQKAAIRSLSTYQRPNLAASQTLPTSIITPSVPRTSLPAKPKIKTCPPPPSPAARFKDPVASLHASQIALHDPTGSRTALFSRTNLEGAKVGDILLVRLKNGDPFAGICINIRRRGIDTGILLRNELTRVGVEMWFKIYSPNIEAIEVVKKREKRARRARLTYYRKKEHDVGSVQGVVSMYLRQRAMVRGRGGEDKMGKKGANKGKGRK